VSSILSNTFDKGLYPTVKTSSLD